MEVVIREYEKEDFLDLATMADDEWKEAMLSTAKSLIEGTNAVEKCLVAEYECKLVGFIYGFVLPNDTLIPEFLYVVPNRRKEGIATRLLATLENSYGCSTSMIFYNKSLHSYYEKQGYMVGEQLEVGLKYIKRGEGDSNEV